MIRRDSSFCVWDFMKPSPEGARIEQEVMTVNTIGMEANDPDAIDFPGHQKNFENVVTAIDPNQAALYK